MGRLAVFTFASVDEIRGFSFDEQFSEHTGFGSCYTRRESLIRRAAEEDANVVLAVAGDENIIGFGVLAYPEPYQRWVRLGPKVMMEVKGIEVIRDWRRMGVGDALAKGMLSHPGAEGKIIYSAGYTWTWDLVGTKMSASQYRNMIVRLFQPYQFQEYTTNEPNICLDHDNLFMCRIGNNVSDRLRDNFKWLRLGVYPDEADGSPDYSRATS